MTFYAIETTSSNSRKIDIFSKGLTHVLVQTRPFLELFFFRQYRPEKCVLRYSWTKKPFSTPWKKEDKPSKDSYWPVKWFYHVVEGKSAFLGYKIKKFKKSKNWDFSKGFGPKMAIFPIFFLANIGQENVFYHILKRKKVFLRYKNKKTSQAKTLTRFP